MEVKSNSSDLLQSIIQANGGLENWDNIQSITTTFMFSGPTLTLKGFPGHHEVKAVIDTKAQKVTFEKLGNICGTYMPTRTEVGLLGSGTSLDVREQPKRAFKNHTVNTQWDQHHLLYFLGYAIWYYFNMPFCFLLPGFHTEELNQQERENGEVWRVLQVTFPEHFPTHTKVQRLYFDQQYRLRRMEYQVDIIAPIPTSHLCYDHRIFDGLILPTFRFANLFPPAISNTTAFTIQVMDVEVNKTPTHYKLSNLENKGV
ncbi:hypothetical protein F5884DRAFT_903214 [Xylogone sp. PMI_703]|nr:hypothetical protein F5884DRAFT_903214 [Xylogone sp. PMI_703]